MAKPTQRELDLGYCEEAQTYCSVAEERYKQGAIDMEKAKQIIIDNFSVVIDTYRDKMFYLMNRIDELSAKPNIEELRKLHYDNIDWLRNNHLINEYYEYFVEQLKEQNNE